MAEQGLVEQSALFVAGLAVELLWPGHPPTLNQSAYDANKLDRFDYAVQDEAAKPHDVFYCFELTRK
ncbi:MAG: hypothetical protein VB093_09780 [Propionicimonas sp.]|nr:hypothetical protein [Propionicimonas sp.]MEA5117031.1 hypothetical protein [Propionicimonas sp.]